MTHRMRSPLLPLLLLCLLHSGGAFSSYQADIPNGDKVHRNQQPWGGVGHTLAEGGINVPDRNQFGEDFKNAGYKWDTALCEMDSDGDNETNGMELGDPDCVWKKGDTPARETSISHPGFDDSTTETEAGLPAIVTPAPTQGPTGQGCFAGASSVMQTGNTPYDCFRSIGGGMELHWTPNTNAGMIDFTLLRPMTDGYMALAVTPVLGTVDMDGGHALIIEPSAWGRYMTSDGAISAKASDDAAIPFTWTSATLTTDNGVVMFKVVGANIAGMVKFSVPTDLNAAVPLIWSTKNTAGVGYHGSSRNGLSLNFATGDSTAISAEDIIDDVELHGILQITAWAFVAPCGIMFKRLGASIPKLQKVEVPGLKLPVPYVLHVVLMITAIALSFAGMMIAVDKFDSHEVDYSHGTTAFATIILAFSQPLPAFLWQFLKPKPDSPNFKKAKLVFGIYHPLVGLVTVCLAAVTVFTGISNYKDLYQDDDKASSFRGAALAGFIVFLLIIKIALAIARIKPKWAQVDAAETDNAAQGAVGETTIGKQS